MKPTILAGLLGAALASGVPAAPTLAADTYAIDRSHTEVFFGWSHAGVSRQHGEFTKVSGTLTIDPSDPQQAVLDVVIDARSLSSGFAPLDKKLMGADYLDVESHPEIRFRSTAVEVVDSTRARVTGDLTLHGVTREVTLETRLTHQGAHPVAQYIDSYRGSWLAFHATAAVDHTAFGVGRYSTGQIAIEINTELQKK